MNKRTLHQYIQRKRYRVEYASGYYEVCAAAVKSGGYAGEGGLIVSFEKSELSGSRGYHYRAVGGNGELADRPDPDVLRHPNDLEFAMGDDYPDQASEFITRFRDQGFPYGQISDALNGKKFPTPSGTGRWTSASVSRIYERSLPPTQEILGRIDNRAFYQSELGIPMKDSGNVNEGTAVTGILRKGNWQGWRESGWKTTGTRI